MHGSTTLEARRSPAYTDRILWHLPQSSQLPAQRLDCEEYTSHQILWSDHRPVSACLTADVRVVNTERRQEDLVVVMKELDKLEEVYRPSLTVSSTNMEFGEVR